MTSYVLSVCENARKKAVAKFGRTEDGVDEDVCTLRKWINSQPHLPEVMEDIKIENFLFMNKFSVEEAKRKIDMYYTIRNLIPDLYEDCNPQLPHMLDLMKNSYCFLHPTPLQEMYRLFFIKSLKPNKFAPRELIMQCSNFGEIRLHEDCMLGDVYIIDLSNVTFNDLTKVTPMLAAKAATLYEKVYSFRVKAAYLINSPSYITVVMTILKAVLKPKIFDRIHVYQDAEILNRLFTKDILPKDYGGEGPYLHELNEMMKEKLAQYQNRFDELDKIRVDESLRPKKLDNDEVLGYYGNFKKLDTD